MKRRLSQQDVLDYLATNPGASEAEIQRGAWGYYRSKKESNKKYADVLRRALQKGTIRRIQVQRKDGMDAYRYRYYLATQSIDVIFSQIQK